jgi:hypothetical protein
MLDGQYREALAEWLAVAARRGLRAPEGPLPALLDLGAKQPELRPGVERVLGERGRWLARLNDAWAFAVSGIDEADWETGSRDARLGLLRRLRETDPARALALVERTWVSEAPSDRAAFVYALRIGLSLADEPFLDAALDDRRKEVRVAASDVLASLPGSRLVERMCERVSARLRFVPSALLRRGRIDVTLPESCDKEMARDGVEAVKRGSLGVKAGMLQQMLAAVPPSVWSEAWGRTPHEIVRLTDCGDWRNVLIDGWARAAERFADEDWAEAIARWRLAEGRFTTEGLVLTMTPGRREALALDLLRSDTSPLRDNNAAQIVLRECRHVWSVELTRMVLASHRRLKEPAGITVPDTTLRYTLKDLARWMAPALADEFAEAFAPESVPGSPWASTVAEAHAILQFRREMYLELGALEF